MYICTTTYQYRGRQAFLSEDMGRAKIWGAPVLQGFVEKEVYKVEADMRKIKRKYHRRRREERISRKRKWSTG